MSIYPLTEDEFQACLRHKIASTRLRRSPLERSDVDAKIDMALLFRATPDQLERLTAAVTATVADMEASR